jgi:hypothetical protein
MEPTCQWLCRHVASPDWPSRAASPLSPCAQAQNCRLSTAQSARALSESRPSPVRKAVPHLTMPPRDCRMPLTHSPSIFSHAGPRHRACLELGAELKAVVISPPALTSKALTHRHLKRASPSHPLPHHALCVGPRR